MDQVKQLQTQQRLLAVPQIQCWIDQKHTALEITDNTRLYFNCTKADAS